MNSLKNGHYGVKLGSGCLTYFSILSSLFLIFLYSGQAFGQSTCKPNSIAASTPDVDFVDHGDGTITHTKTGLMWMKCTIGLSGLSCGTGTQTSYTWTNALAAVKTFNITGFAGYSDWRMPNIKELMSIVEQQCVGPAINQNIFPTPFVLTYLSSSPVNWSGPNGNKVWAVNFSGGSIKMMNKITRGYLRLVRAGL